ncbi:Alpha/Beta hydrolase protein [Phlyctochytrium arcticum]|nr:Alpha/Beta hydrolase protein [Phlyctochytrium arcticum]
MRGAEMKDILRTPDGATLAFTVLNGGQKDATPILLIMGLGGVKEDWGPFAQALAQDRQVCIMDNRGLGESKQSAPIPPFRDPPQLTIMQMATDAFSILCHLDWKRCHLLGASMGGMIALQLALLLRGRDDFFLQTLTLLSTSCRGGSSPSLNRFYRQISEVASDAKTRDVGAKTKALFCDFMELNYTPKWCYEHQETLQSRLSERLPPLDIIEQQAEAIVTFDISDQVQNIQQPTLIIHGMSDQLVPFDDGQVLSEILPNAKLLALPDVGHITYEMDNGKSLSAVQSFLSS